jgi:hypothetical protein
LEVLQHLLQLAAVMALHLQQLTAVAEMAEAAVVLLKPIPPQRVVYLLNLHLALAQYVMEIMVAQTLGELTKQVAVAVAQVQLELTALATSLVLVVLEQMHFQLG